MYADHWHRALYPAVGRYVNSNDHSILIVQFERYGVGTVIESTNEDTWVTGSKSDTWNMHVFEPTFSVRLTETFTLREMLDDQKRA